jgi:hypothetical protein
MIRVKILKNQFRSAKENRIEKKSRPAGIPEPMESKHLVSTVDIIPSCLDAAGIELPGLLLKMAGC